MVKPVDYLLELVKRPLRYVFHFNTIVGELRKQKKNLTKEQTRVQEDVEEAKRHIQTLEIKKDVEKWLTDAENVLKEAESLEQRIEENKRCFRWCPNWCWRYELSKKIEQKTLAINELVESSNFERVGHRAALPSIEFLSSKDLIASKSSTSAFNQIMEALRSDEVNMIGVWGMGGVGKTTLVTEVGNQVKDFQLFHRVIKVVVSQAPDVRKIQDRIKEVLDFKFESTTQEGKAAELWARLKKEEKVLIILDDLWNKLNLLEIGIPVGENHKGCTIILTTRRRQVCEDMESQVTVPLGTLVEDEAWTLFKMNASLDNASPNIIVVAKDVAKECGGLPIAIVTLARALRSRDLNGWELARHKLERSRYMDIERVPKEDQNAYLCLEMSYKYLERETTKRCFLLCALYPEDYSIDVEDLVRYAWALSLYKEAGSVKEVRREVYEAINNLKDSCLLSEDDDERNIKLHDVVRDVALWIASKEDNGLVTKSGVASENESSKQKLEILLLDEYDTKTPIERFEWMPELKVLSVRKRASKSYNDHNSFFSLDALESLTNLRALHLEGFKQLEGISALAKLTKLEILSLRGFEFHESIDNLGELKNLRVLDMCHCHFLLGVRPSLIRRLVKVEELYLFGSTIKRLVHGAFLLELNLLPRLASLFLKVSSQNFPKDFVFPKLQRYNILINGDELTDWNDFSPNSLMISKELRLNVISELVWNVENLVVSEVKVKDIKFLTDTTPGNVSVATILQNLKCVGIGDCENLEVIFYMKKVENQALLLSNLKWLVLWGLPNLEYIWEMPTQHICLRSLEVVKIEGCGQLKSLLSFSLAQSLECLRKLKIDGCGELKQIVGESEGDEQEISTNMNLNKPLCLPKLKSLKIKNCGSLEYIFPNFMAPEGLPQLQKLSLAFLSQLKQICRPAKQREENGILLPQLQLLPSLTDLILHDCPDLTDAAIHSEPMQAVFGGVQLSQLIQTGFVVNAKEIFLCGIGDSNLIPEVYPEGLNELSVLQLHSCNSLEYLVDTTKEHVPNSAFSNLVGLFLGQMGGLKTLCNGQFPKGFLQNLKKLRIQGCPRLEYVLPITLAQGLPQLEKLEIESNSNLHSQLKQVFGVAKQHDGVEHWIKLPCLKELQLYYLTNLSSFGPKNYFFKAPALERLCVCACPQLMKFTIQQEVNSRVDLQVMKYYEGVRLSTFKEFLRSANVDVDLQGLTSLSLEDCEDLECLANTADEDHVPTSEVFTNLVELRMKNMIGFKVLWNGQPSRGFLQNLKSLSVESCEKLEEIFGIDELLCNTEQNQPPLLSNLDSLHLTSMSELRWIVKGPTQYVSLRSLRDVSIEKCNKLESLFSSSLIPSLSLLEELRIDQCDELKTVFTEDETESNALCMPNLKSLWIINCPTLKYVLAIACALDLPCLQILSLDGLTNLSSVTDCPENCFIKAPALKKLEVSGCPQLSNFTFQQHKPLQSKDFEECIDEAELCNNKLRERSPNMMNFDQPFLPSTGDNFMSNLDLVKLSDLDWLRYIWKAPTQVVVTNLRDLEVYNCNRLTYVFPAMLVRYLRQLWTLKIWCCEKLEQIIVNDDTSASSSQGHETHDEDEMGAKNKKEMLIFPQLRNLLLKELPSLPRFSLVGYHLIFPSLDSLEIRGCSQMITSFTADSIQSVHATEAPRLDDATPSIRDICWGRNSVEEDASLPPYMEEAEEI